MTEQGYAFDGFQNVVEMLKYSDGAFRKKIIQNIAQRNPKLAKRILQATKEAINKEVYTESQSVLRQSQQRAQTRSYGR